MRILFFSSKVYLPTIWFLMKFIYKVNIVHTLVVLNLTELEQGICQYWPQIKGLIWLVMICTWYKVTLSYIYMLQWRSIYSWVWCIMDLFIWLIWFLACSHRILNLSPQKYTNVNYMSCMTLSTHVRECLSYRIKFYSIY